MVREFKAPSRESLKAKISATVYLCNLFSCVTATAARWPQEFEGRLCKLNETCRLNLQKPPIVMESLAQLVQEDLNGRGLKLVLSCLVWVDSVRDSEAQKTGSLHISCQRSVEMRWCKAESSVVNKIFTETIFRLVLVLGDITDSGGLGSTWKTVWVLICCTSLFLRVSFSLSVYLNRLLCKKRKKKRGGVGPGG